MFKKIDLKNKTALVTGAGKGLGKACAIALAEAGAKVIIVSRTLSDLNKVEKLIKKTKGSCLKFECDVTNLNKFKNILNKVKKLDILVNNAGNNRPEHFTKVKKENMEYLVELNMKAAFNVAQMCSQKMIKFGLEGLTRGMAIELAKYNIRVNSVCPTFVETPMVKAFFKNKKFKKQVLENIPLGRVAQENDVSTAVAFLAASSSNSITGTSLMVDGGWTAK